MTAQFAQVVKPFGGYGYPKTHGVEGAAKSYAEFAAPPQELPSSESFGRFYSLDISEESRLAQDYAQALGDDATRLMSNYQSISESIRAQVHAAEQARQSQRRLDALDRALDGKLERRRKSAAAPKPSANEEAAMDIKVASVSIPPRLITVAQAPAQSVQAPAQTPAADASAAIIPVTKPIIVPSQQASPAGEVEEDKPKLMTGETEEESTRANANMPSKESFSAAGIKNLVVRYIASSLDADEVISKILSQMGGDMSHYAQILISVAAMDAGSGRQLIDVAA